MTEDEVIQLLEQADPVRRIEPGPTVDAVGYLDDLRTGSTTVTLTHTGPTAKPALGRRRRWPIIAVAAAVMAIVVGGLALVARDQTSDTHRPAAPSATAPATTTTATPAEVTAAEETARAFIDAENAYDVDRIVTYLDVVPAKLDELRLEVAWHQAVGSKKLDVHCAPQGESAVVAGIVIFCTYDYHSLRSDDIGLGPYRGYSEFTIRDGKIGPAELDMIESARARFSSQMEKPFRRWMSANHPADIAVMYAGSEPRISEESIPLWEQRTREYAARDGASGEVPRPLPNGRNIDDERDWFEPGTYYVDEVDGTLTPRIFATLDSRWSNVDEGWYIAKGGMPDEGGIGLMTITNPVRVFADACQPSDGFHPGPVDTVDGFVTALMEQQGGWVDATEPSDISIDGYLGKAIQRTAPAVMSDCTSMNGETQTTGSAIFPSWESAAGINGGYSPGQVETLWVLDIDGTVIVISTTPWPGPSGTTDADFADAVLDSIRIGRP